MAGGDDPVLGCSSTTTGTGRGLRRPARRRGGDLLLERVGARRSDPRSCGHLRDDTRVGDPGPGGPPGLHRLLRVGRRAPARARLLSPSTRWGSTTSPPRWPCGGGPGATWASSRSTSPGPRRARPWPSTSVRDLYASGGPPELAGGDFGAEAHRLGTMAARMHLGLDEAFGRRAGTWAAGPTPSRRRAPAVAPPARPARRGGAAGGAPGPAGPLHAIRTHGDFHIGRVARTEQGWYVTDFSSGGRPTSIAGAVAEPDGDEPVYRSPLADVADMLWSLERVATTPPPSATRRAATASASWPTPGRCATGGPFSPATWGWPGSAASSRPGAKPCRSSRRLRARPGGGPAGPPEPTMSPGTRMPMRLGILTGGGDCPGLNAVIRAVVLTAATVTATRPWGSSTAGRACSRTSASISTSDGAATSCPWGDDPGDVADQPLRRCEGGPERVAATLAPRGSTPLVAIGGEDTLGVAQRLGDHGVHAWACRRPSTTTWPGPRSPSGSTPPCRSPPTPSTGCAPRPNPITGSSCARSWVATPGGSPPTPAWPAERPRSSSPRSPSTSTPCASG